jgi:lysozyme family protein
MASTFDAAWPSIKILEGKKYTDIVGDPGGPTKCGITLRNAQLHNLDIDHDGDVDADDIKNLTEEEEKEFYRKFWWLPAYEQIDEQAVATKLIDTDINVGRIKSCTWMQQACNKLYGAQILKEDGVFGQKTLDSINKFHGDALLETFRQLQADFYTRWVNAKLEVRQKFLAGLLNRARA